MKFFLIDLLISFLIASFVFLGYISYKYFSEPNVVRLLDDNKPLTMVILDHDIYVTLQRS